MVHVGDVVSEGTLRLVDLVGAFTDALTSVDPSRANHLAKRHYVAYRAVERVGDGPCCDWDFTPGERTAVGWLVEELQTSLDRCAPEGTHFGSHEGDGACFGFWAT